MKLSFGASRFNRLVSRATLQTGFLTSFLVLLPGMYGQNLTTLYNFTGPDGAYPDGNVVADGSGALYGTTLLGGEYSNGAIYKLTPPQNSGPWTETVLYSFTGGSDGSQPGAGLIFSKAGALYGTASRSNGNKLQGVVFKLAPRNGGWNYSVIYSFSGGSDGGVPNCNLLFDASGNLYGTTGIGGAYKSGTIFELTPPDGSGPWTETVLYSLNGSTDGSRPMAGLVQDSSGALYGTASEGGIHNLGTAFKLSPVGSTWVFQLLVTFNGLNGQYPIGALLLGPQGVVYGTTWLGNPQGYGVVFQLTPNAKKTNYTETVIYDFSGSDGSNPSSPLIYDSVNNVFYGTTMGFLVGYGNVFQLTPPAVVGGVWTETVLYSFVSDSNDGQTAISGLLLLNGSIYSITYYAGTANAGTVFQLTLDQPCAVRGAVPHC